jgi:hypothetical protein
LLFFAVVEVIAAKPCADELGDFAPAQISATKNPRLTMDNRPSQNLGEQRFISSNQSDHAKDSGADCDECFCCCSHILPSPTFYTASVILENPAVVINTGTMPTSPSRDTFHPPRTV